MSLKIAAPTRNPITFIEGRDTLVIKIVSNVLAGMLVFCG